MKRIFLILLLTITAGTAFALSYKTNDGSRCHRDDFAAVLPFVWDARLDKWGKTLTDNLDKFHRNSVEEYGGLSTYEYFKQNFGLSMGYGDHRLFFHWGYQTRPWDDRILHYIKDPATLNDPARLQAFKDAVRDEQARRNRLANALTEEVLGFGSHGVQAAYANAFIAIIYDVHILGDYETPNINGLAPVSVLAREIATQLERIDRTHSKPLATKIRSIGNQSGDERQKAKLLLQTLRDDLPQFILNADDGRINMRQHFQNRGFRFK